MQSGLCAHIIHYPHESTSLPSTRTIAASTFFRGNPSALRSISTHSRIFGNTRSKQLNAALMAVPSRLTPPRMIPALLSALRITTRHLQVSLRARRNPNIRPRWRNHKRLDPCKRLIRFCNRLAITRPHLAKAFAGPLSNNSRLCVRNTYRSPASLADWTGSLIFSCVCITSKQSSYGRRT